MKTVKVFVLLQILVFLVTMTFLASHSTCQSTEANIWYVHDTIDPSLDGVKWREEGAIEEARPSIAGGLWFSMSKRESLVSASDIFVSTYERFNWSRLAPALESLYGSYFASFDDFAGYLKVNVLWWLRDTWNMNPEWYGILANGTTVDYSFNEVGSEVELWTSFHITRPPEYFVGNERLESWLTGFDLTLVSTGNLRIYDFRLDSNLNGTYYNLYFEAPANILSQHGENFTLNIDISPSSRGQVANKQQVIDLNMPADTEIAETSPANLSVPRGNTATFVLAKDDHYPMSFTVLSGPPAKSLSQVVWESASVWVLTPGGWAAIASLLVLSYTALRGRRVWRRSRLYHRLYNSMVTIYDL